MNIRNRIKELRNVSATELKPSARNWRTHPKAQQDALRGVLAEIGFADAVLVRELEDGSLELIDGHLRTEVMGDASPDLLHVSRIKSFCSGVILRLAAAASSGRTSRLPGLGPRPESRAVPAPNGRGLSGRCVPTSCSASPPPGTVNASSSNSSSNTSEPPGLGAANAPSTAPA